MATKEKESEEAQCSEAKETKRSDTKEAKRSESEEVECSESKESEQEIIAKKADWFEVIEWSRNDTSFVLFSYHVCKYYILMFDVLWV